VRGKLKRQLTLAMVGFILLSSLPIGFLAIHQMNQNRNLLIKTTDVMLKQSLGAGDALAGSIGSWLSDIVFTPEKQLAEEISGIFWQLRRQKDPQGRIRSLVENYRDILSGSIRRVVYADAVDENFTYVYPAFFDRPVGYDVRAEQWYDDIRNTPTRTVSAPFWDPENNELQVVFGYPVFEISDFRGAVGFYLSLTHLSELARNSAIYDKNLGRYTAFLFIVYLPKDVEVSAPVILAHPDQKLVGLPLNGDYQSIYGAKARMFKKQFEEKIGLNEDLKKQFEEAYKKIKEAKVGQIIDLKMMNQDLRAKIVDIPGTPWKLVAAVDKEVWLKPSQEMAASIARTRNIFLILTLILVFLAAFLTCRFLSRIFDPLIELEKKILRMAEGDLREDLQYPYDNDIKLIVDAINKMKSNLKETIDMLRKGGE